VYSGFSGSACRCHNRPSAGVSNIAQFFLAGERRLAIEGPAARRPRFKQTADRTFDQGQAVLLTRLAVPSLARIRPALSQMEIGTCTVRRKPPDHIGGRPHSRMAGRSNRPRHGVWVRRRSHHWNCRRLHRQLVASSTRYPPRRGPPCGDYQCHHRRADTPIGHQACSRWRWIGVGWGRRG